MESTYKILGTTTGKARYDFLQGTINDFYHVLIPALHSTDTTEVFLAKSLKDSKLCAIKLIDEDSMTDNLKKGLSLQSDFSKIDLAPRVYDQLNTGGNYAVVLELMNGCSLRDQLEKMRKFPEQKVKEVALFLVDALKKLSSRQIVHNGIRPSQILVNITPEEATYKLSGFENTQSLTNLRFFEVENPEYTSPEIRNGKAPLLASDIWSVGATLYRLATGKDTSFIVSENVLEVSETLRKVIKGCLKANPNERITLHEIEEMYFIHFNLFRLKEEDEPIIDDDFPKLIRVLHKKAGIENVEVRLQKNDRKPYIITESKETGYGFMYWCYKHNKAYTKDDKYIIRAIDSKKLEQPEMKKRLVQELAIQKKMENSPYCNVMKDSFIWEEENKRFEFCMVTKCYNGLNLEEYLKKTKEKLRTEDMQLILWNIACALRDIHTNNMTHRRIEPANIFLKLDEEQIISVLLSDFGLGDAMTETSHYIAPEMKNAKKGECTSKVDVWSFGILMHKLLFGKTPYETKLNIMGRIVSGKKMQYPATKDNDQYINLIDNCLVINPDDRYTINDVIGHEYFNMVVFVQKKKLAPYTIKSEVLSNLGQEYYLCTKSKVKNSFMAKKIPASDLNDFEANKRISREIAAMVRLRNGQNIIKFYDYFYYEKYIYLIMENVSQYTLDNYIKEKYKQTTIEGRRLLIFEILKPIKDVHDHNFFHRGITPKTIIVRYDKKTAKVEAVRLFEFEMAKTSIDVSIVHIGTDVCIAPELAMGGEGTKAADIWAFGMIIYFIIFGVRFLQYEGNDHKSAWTGAINMPKDSPDPEMVKILRACLNKDPALRPSANKLYDVINEMVKKE